MNRPLHLLAVCFCAGLLGALLSSLFMVALAKLGVFALLGVQLAPQLRPAWLNPRLLWGGLWGLAYFFAVRPVEFRNRWARRGMWISIFPTAFELVVVFPYWSDYGLLGQHLGRLTPLVVLLVNMIWGVGTGIFCRLLWGRP